jgi:hypothetical protein
MGKYATYAFSLHMFQVLVLWPDDDWSLESKLFAI